MTKQKRDDLQPRDRHYIVDVPKGKFFIQKKSSIKKWLEKVVSNSVSIAFNYYIKDQMTYEQAKVYCSQNIIKNIAILTQQYNLTGEQFKQIDQYLRDSIIPILQKKYPLTETINVNKELQSLAIAPDQSKHISNDFLFHNKIFFDLRKSENYDDLIKGVINLIIQTTNQSSLNYPSMKTYEEFERTMKKIFQLVEVKQHKLVHQKDSLLISEEEQHPKIRSNINYNNQVKNIEKQSTNDEIEVEKKEYRQKVKQYTHYLIGRKLPSHISPFSKDELQSKTFQMKSPAVLRILTKWCQQLKDKFVSKNYFLNKKGDIPLNNGELKPYSQYHCGNLDKLMQQEIYKINEFMKNLVKETYKTQLDLFKQLLDEKDDQFWEQNLVKVSGKFSVLIGMSLQKWILKYLTRLIHGLLTVADTFHKDYVSKQWSCPPNLLTFSIGDLMRCKCSSQQRQIIRIFKYLKEISAKNPQKLKILRVKNRLNLGTNDILINLRFENKMTCEMQLAINQKKSKFIVASNKMSHFLYQLQRSMFGPINELCSIQRNFDQRCLIYTKEASFMMGEGLGEVHKCEMKGVTFSLDSFNTPFTCSVCTKTYSQNIYVFDHVKCSQCYYWKCAKCFVRTSNFKELIKSLIKNEDLQIYCQELFQRKQTTDQLPQYGMVINWQQKDQITPRMYKKYVIRGTTYLIQKTQTQLRSILTYDNQQKLKQFQRNHLIIKFSRPQCTYPQQEQFDLQFVMMNKLRQISKENKCQLTLNSKYMKDFTLGLNYYVFPQQLIQQMKKITKLNLHNTDIQVSTINQFFPCLQHVQLIKNGTFDQTVLDYGYYGGTDRQVTMKQSEKIQKIYFENCRLYARYQFLNLPKIRQITITGTNKFYYTQQIFQHKKVEFTFKDVSNLQRLTVSQLYRNLEFKYQSIDQLKNLKMLDLRFNGIHKLQQQFIQFQQLQELYLQGNPIKYFPSTVANLKTLHRFQMIFDLAQYPSDLQEITNLAVFSNNNFDAPCPSLEKCHNLQTVAFKTQNIPKIGKCQRLKQLKIQGSQNTEKSIEENLMYLFQKCNKLQTLQLQTCKFSRIPKQIGLLQNLFSLTLQKNNLQVLPEELGKCISLKTLTIRNNKVTAIPSSFKNLINLESVQITSNEITSFDNVTHCKKLKKLNLNSNKIQQIPISISNLQLLQELDLSSNRIYYIPKEMQALTSIKEIKTNNNPIYCIHQNSFNKKHFIQQYSKVFNRPQFQTLALNQPVQFTSRQIKYMIYLTGVQISNQQWKSMPQQFAQLHSLKKLKLRDIKFENFPLVITRCSGLQRLAFSCQIEQLPKEIGNLSALTKLCLTYTKIQILPKEIGNLSALTKLYLYSNKIQQLPKEIGNLSALTELSLKQNQIKDLPIEFNKLTALKQLDISKNQLQILNDQLFSTMKQLTRIDFQNNKMVKLPQGQFECINLQTILLQSNQLVSINGKYQNLQKLGKLGGFYNKLTALPKNLANAENIALIYLSFNQIVDIDIQYQKFVRLQDITLNNNKITELPQSLTNLKDTFHRFDIQNNNIQAISDNIKTYIDKNYQNFQIKDTPMYTTVFGCRRRQISIYCQEGYR